MSVRIAFDLDGVLAAMESRLLREAETLFGRDAVRRNPDLAATVDPGDPPPATDTPPPSEMPALASLRLSARQQQRLWRHIATIENFWESLDEIEPGAVAQVAANAMERRWEIIFLTKRPATSGATAQMQTQRWLSAKGFPLPSVFVVQESRGRIASALGLDIVVDDRPENCLDVVMDSKARAILVWRDPQQQLPAAAKRLGIGMVGSVAECLDVLTQIDAPARAKPNVVGRVMRLLGLEGTGVK